MVWHQPGVCQVCNAPLPPRRSKNCSTKCEKARAAQIYRQINGPRLAVPTATVGAINELLVGIDLLKRGLPVFRALSPSSPGDLAVLLDNKLVIVEVTTGSRTIRGVLVYPLHKGQAYDVLAVVERSGKIIYTPDLFVKSQE